jgi:hypothetical protein
VSAVAPCAKPLGIAPTATPSGQNWSMARTHGTRSAYSAGCRCDACREATRVARARQRAGSGWAPVGFVPTNPAHDVALQGHPGVGMALAGVAALCTGGWALWHGATMPTDEDTDPEAVARTRRRWLLAGSALVLAGILVLARAGSAGAEGS